MRLIGLIFNNLRRQKIRSLPGVASIAVAAAVMLMIMSIGQGAAAMAGRIFLGSGDILIVERNPSEVFFGRVRADELRGVRELASTKSAQPLLIGFVSANEHPVVACLGVEIGSERVANANWLAGSQSDFGRKRNGVSLGSRAARFLNAGLGDSIEIGRANFTVSGILETGNAFEDGAVFLPLSVAQEVMNKSTTISMLAVKIVSGSTDEEFKRVTESSFPGLLALGRHDLSKSLTQFEPIEMASWAIGVAAFFVGALGIANTMYHSVFRRTRELAVFRICGFSPGQLSVLIFGEAIVVATVGLAVGCAAGWMVIRSIEKLQFALSVVQPTFEPRLFAVLGLMALGSAVAGTVFPALAAARIKPTEGLGHE